MKRIGMLIILSFISLNFLAINVKGVCRNWKEDPEFCKRELEECEKEFSNNLTEEILSLGCRDAVCAETPELCPIWESKMLEAKKFDILYMLEDPFLW